VVQAPSALQTIKNRDTLKSSSPPFCEAVYNSGFWLQHRMVGLLVNKTLQSTWMGALTAQFEKPFGSAVIHDSVCRLRCELDISGLQVRSVMNRPNLIGNIFFDPHPVPKTQKLRQLLSYSTIWRLSIWKHHCSYTH